MMTSTISPYCFDIPHVLGLPTGISHRFRYREKWIEPELTDIEGSDALIILKHVDAAQKQTLIPICIVEIEGVITDIDITLFEFQFKSYVDPATCLSNLQAPAGKLVFNEDITANPKDGMEDSEHLNILLQALGKLECYKDFSFLRVLSVYDSKRRKVLPEKNGAGKFVYKFHPGNLYFLDVMQYIPWEIERTECITKSYNVELKTEENAIQLLRKVQRVVGKYDVLRFIFKIPNKYTTQSTYLELVDNQTEGAGNRLPSLFLPVEVDLTRRMKIDAVLSFLLSLVAIYIIASPKTMEELSGFKADYWRAVATLFLILSTNSWNELFSSIVKEKGKSWLQG